MDSSARNSEANSVTGTQAISRSVQVLRAVAQLQRSGATATKIARQTGLSRPTIFRILRALEAERLLERREDRRQYWLGSLAFELGLAAKPITSVRSRWQAAVEHVARRTRLTSYLIGRSGNEAVCLLCVQGASAIRAMPVEVGQRVPLGKGAGSLVILASLSDEEISRIIGTELGSEGIEARKSQDRQDLLKRVERTRQDGFSLSSSTVAKGVSGVGVLVPDTTAEQPLAITVSVVAEKIAWSEARKLAAELSAAVNDIKSLASGKST